MKSKLAKEDLRNKLAVIGLFLKGSLAEIHKPCIRKNCEACASGEMHPAHILSFTQDGKRRCMYVPAELTKVIEQGLQNGRLLEKLMYEAGPRLLREYRARRDSVPRR